MTTRHRFTAAAAVAGVLAIAAPAVNASADTGLAAHASGSAVGASLAGAQLLPVLGGGRVGASAAAGPDGGQIGATAGLDSWQAALTATQDAWRFGATAGLNGMRAGATAGLAGMDAGATAVRNVWQTGLGMIAPHQHP
jgi:hypothetical protein